MANSERPISAANRRAEQLKRWQESETNLDSSSERRKCPKIQFPDGCVFLAACASADKDEVKKRLEQNHTDIDTANIDGLTALHQACIDDNLEMVEFLVEHGSDINRGDNEGWTPLHATASCGFISIAKYLIDCSANVAAVNNDGDLPIDIAEITEMEELLQAEINRNKIDCEKARNTEEKLMMQDAEQYAKDPSIPLKVHEKTGATPLHVAAAKGYANVMSSLINAGVNLDSQDFDGWTPLHAAAHWYQQEACELLIESFCDMETKNFAGQTAFDVADTDILPLMKELKEKQATLKRNRKEVEPSVKKADTVPLKRRTSVTRMSVTDKSNAVMKDLSAERAALLKHPEKIAEGKSPRIEEMIEEDESNVEDEEKNNNVNKIEQNDVLNDLIEKSKNEDVKIKPMPNKGREDALISPKQTQNPPVSSWFKVPANETKTTESSATEDAPPSPWRRTRTRSTSSSSDKVEQESPSPSSENASQPALNARINNVAPLNRTNRNCASWNLPTITNTSLLRSASFPSFRHRNNVIGNEDGPLAMTTSLSTNTLSAAATVTSPTLVTTSLPCSTNVRRSMVPPIRDEESETQRRAHAKRVRETRRSTQGVTLEDLKSAEQQFLRKQQEEDEKKERENDMKTSTGTSTCSTNSEAEKRTLWRQRYQQLQDDEADNPLYRRSRNAANGSTITSTVTTALTTPTITTSSHQNVTLPLRNSNDSQSANSAKENEEDDRNTNHDKSQAVIIRRRRPKRRSTGVVHLDVDDDGSSSNKSEDKSTLKEPSDEIGSKLNSSSQSLAFSQDDLSASSTAIQNGSTDRTDFKKLYDDVTEENKRLKERLTKSEAALKQAQDQVEKFSSNNRNSISDAEKRERRALERKLSEMEEELKQLDQLKLENSKYKEENGALIRVISKLSK